MHDNGHVDYNSERVNDSHVDYPHNPGSHYGCAACESECYCGNGTPPGVNPECCGLAPVFPGCCHTECVFCALIEESESRTRDINREEG